MRLYLQTAPGADRIPRYYHLIIQKDLLTGWTLVKETGQQGSTGKVTRQHFDTWEDAQAALISSRDQQLKRGYRVVFVQGQEKPL